MRDDIDDHTSGEWEDTQRLEVHQRIVDGILALHEKHEGHDAHEQRDDRHQLRRAEDRRNAVEQAEQRDGDQGDGRDVEGGLDVLRDVVDGGQPLDGRDSNLEVGHDAGETNVEEGFVEGGDKSSQRGREHDCQRHLLCGSGCGRARARRRRRSHEAFLGRMNRIGFGGVSRFTCGYSGGAAPSGRGSLAGKEGATQRVSYSRPWESIIDRGDRLAWRASTAGKPADQPAARWLS